MLTFFLVDVLDNTGTLIATTQRAGLMRPDGTIPRLREALLADSCGAIIGSLLGTSTTTSYIESAAGIGLGFRVYAVVKAAAGRIGAISGAVWLVAGLSLLKFVLGG